MDRARTDAERNLQRAKLAPLLLTLECWLAPRHYALARAATAFDEEGRLIDPQQRVQVRAVVEQVLWAAQRLHGAG